MHRTTLAALVGALVVASALASAGLAMGFTGDTGPSAQTAPPTTSTNDRSITVSAMGDADAQPDTAVLRLGIQAESPDAATARSQVAENVSAVRAALLDLGIDESDIRTSDYNIYRTQPRPPDGKAQPETVYRARHGLVVDLADVDMAGEAIDAAVDAGATDVRDVQFTLSPETRLQLRNEALTEAMSNARSEADTLATSADLQISDVRTVTTQNGFSPGPRYETAMASGGATGTDIHSGPVTVTATVTVTYNASR